MRNKIVRPREVTENRDNILRYIKNTMKVRSISQAEIADEIRMNHHLFNRKINGHIEFKFDEILDILRLLKLDIDIE